MKKKLIRLAVVFGLLITCVQISSAQTESQSREITPKTLTESALYMQDIEGQIDVTKKEYNNLSGSISKNKQKLSEIRKEIMSLQDQLNNLDFLAEETEKKIINVTKQITQKRNDMQTLANHIETKNSILDDQLDLLADYAKFLYVQDNEYSSPERALLGDEPVSEIVQTRNYTEILQDSGIELAENLKDISFELDQNKKALVVKSAHLAELKEKLAEDQNMLAEQKEARERLLEATRGEEDVYSQLIAQSKSQQNAVLGDINTLNDNLTFLRSKFKEYGEDFNTENYRTLISKSSRAVFEYQAQNKKTGALSFMWPVSPSRGLSAYFLDPSYKATFGVPHYAVDIRVPQMTPVSAPEDGIVYRASDNGIGYSYIILAHRNGVMTVYGHIYEMKVKEGEMVRKGDVIGLSGGMPGTKGAGFMTTGPHLHFEILQNGKHKDPLDFLPLIHVPFDSLPEKYAERLKGKKNTVESPEKEALDEEKLKKSVESEGVYGYDDNLNIDVNEYIDFEE